MTTPPKKFTLGKILSVFIPALFLLITVSSAIFYMKWQPYAMQAVSLLPKMKLRSASAEELYRLGSICNTLGKKECSIEVFSRLVTLDPSDTTALANLAINESEFGTYEKAIADFDHYFSLGGGAVDSYFKYAKTLSLVGRTDDAILANYQAFQLEPYSVDILKSLIQSLVIAKRLEEALSLIRGSISTYPILENVFSGNRISIESELAKKTRVGGDDGLVFPAVQSHFFIPLRFDAEHFFTFLYDTGATNLMLSTEVVYKSRLEQYDQNKIVVANVADGRKVSMRELRIPVLWVGSIELRNVIAVYCDGCSLLMGHSVMSRFESSVQRIGGGEFLKLKKVLGE